MLDGQGYDISCDLVMKVSVGGQVRSVKGSLGVSTCARYANHEH